MTQRSNDSSVIKEGLIGVGLGTGDRTEGQLRSMATAFQQALSGLPIDHLTAFWGPMLRGSEGNSDRRPLY